MSYKIIVDSCCDLTDSMKTWGNLTVVPLTLQIGDYVIKDDIDFNQDDFIKRMTSSTELAKSACPSPHAFADACRGEEQDIYILTITDKLSGTYNSALQGVEIYKETPEGSAKNIHVFNSLATAGLETLLALSIKTLADSGAAFADVVDAVEGSIANNYGLYFCLESLDALKGNGRLYNIGARIIEALRVKLVCRRTEYGNISIAGKDFSANRALIKLVDLIKKDSDGCDLTDRAVIISHVCCPDKAELVKKYILEKTAYKNVTVLRASGLNSLYASNGGIIVSFSK
ncbi:MAG: DegV family protein [Clostridiales bacterium]|nr:DegV family protein [Clostridiales bacterium]